MEQSGTPCPFEGKIGTEATKQWSKYNKLRPDYDIYTKRLKVVQKADKIEAAEQEKLRLKELEEVQKKKKELELQMKKEAADEASFNKLKNTELHGMADVIDEKKSQVKNNNGK